MIATTMLVVGLFAILSWDSIFPDRRDVLVLATLPIRTRTIFCAKVAAVATALSLTIATLHVASGFVWPLSLNSHHEAVIAPSIAYDTAMPPLNPASMRDPSCVTIWSPRSNPEDSLPAPEAAPQSASGRTESSKSSHTEPRSRIPSSRSALSPKPSRRWRSRSWW